MPFYFYLKLKSSINILKLDLLQLCQHDHYVYLNILFLLRYLNIENTTLIHFWKHEIYQKFKNIAKIVSVHIEHCPENKLEQDHTWFSFFSCRKFTCINDMRRCTDSSFSNRVSPARRLYIKFPIQTQF